MDGVNLAQKLLSILGIERKRAEDLMNAILDLAIKHEGPGFIVAEWTTLFKMAETPEEAFFIGHFATLLADDMAAAMNLITILARAEDTMEVLAKRMAEKIAHN